MNVVMAALFLILAACGIVGNIINKNQRNETMIWAAIVASQVWIATGFIIK